MKLSIRDTYIWLNSLGISAKTISTIEDEIDNIENLWDMTESEILDLNKIRKTTLEKLTKNRNSIYIEDLNKKLDSNLFNITTIIDEDYPKRLKEIYDPPKVLYYMGNKILDEPSIAVVGSRKMTDYGKWATERLVSELSNIGVTIISGLALGIDGVAHKTTLKNQGKTIGVLGNGIDIIYPNLNRRLFEEIPNKGTIVSEFPLGTKPLPYNFPLRNRIISGLSLGVLVVEAKERSGSLITAYQALEQDRDVFAVPGNINSIYSKGCNMLIQDGAKMVLDFEDILDEIKELQDIEYTNKADKFKNVDLSELELKVFNEIKKKPISCDEIVIKTAIDISTVNSVLTILEIKGLIEEMTGRVFTLS